MAESVGSIRYSPYPSRHLRHACENCRRKKTRCSGEHPACSTCARLHQQCVYLNSSRIVLRGPSDEPTQESICEDPQLSNLQSTSSRLSAIETRLEQISAVLGANEPHRRPPSRSDYASEVHQHDRSFLNLPNDAVNEGILLYFSHYCNSPLPLLDHLASEPMSHRYPIIVLDAMLALTLRRAASSSVHFKDTKDQDLDALVEHLWHSLANTYRRFDFDEAFFQALCILAQIDYAEGRSDRARTQVGLGLRLAQTRGMLNAEHCNHGATSKKRQHQEIVWSLFMLDRMLIDGKVLNPSITGARFTLPKYSGGPNHPGYTNEVCDSTVVRSSSRSSMIMSQYIQIIRTWGLVAEYINEDSIVDSMPLWHHQSPRTTILNDLLEFEIPCEPHTYASVGPIDRVLCEPSLKPYFCAWTYFQITHSAIHCCINHPFIIFVKVRQYGSRVPLTFLQKAHKDSLIYASWASKTVSDMEAARLDVLDPFLAYLVGIAASIHLEHSLSSESFIAFSAREKLATCMTYLERVSQVWPKVRKRVVVLQHLQARLGNRSALHYVEDEYDGAVPVRSARHVSLSSTDEQLMWMLFDPSNESMPGTLRHAAIATEPDFRSASLTCQSEGLGSSVLLNDATTQVESTVQLHAARTTPYPI